MNDAERNRLLAMLLHPCDNINELANLYVDREMDFLSMHVFGQHVASCKDCEQVLAEFERLILIASEIGDKKDECCMPNQVSVRLREALRKNTSYGNGDLTRHRFFV